MYIHTYQREMENVQRFEIFAAQVSVCSTGSVCIVKITLSVLRLDQKHPRLLACNTRDMRCFVLTWHVQVEVIIGMYM